jgi:hypothetical protein
VCKPGAANSRPWRRLRRAQCESSTSIFAKAPGPTWRRGTSIAVFGRCEIKNGIGPVDSLVSEVMNQAPYRAARRVFWIMDNCSAHHGQKAADRFRSQWPNAILSTPRSLPVGSTRSRSACRSFREKFSRPTTSVLWPNSKTVCLLSRPTTNAVPLPSGGPSPAKICRLCWPKSNANPRRWLPNPSA